MFKGQFGGLELTGECLDLSYRDPDSWPMLLPSGAICSFTFDIGDPDRGPTFQLGRVTPVPGELLDWKHSIDPVHYHGSDQFRFVLGGDWTLANHAMPKGSASFQEAGWVYQEHPGAGGAAWTALLVGDRRGMPATLHFAKDANTILQAGEAFGQPLGETAPYPHPAGSKGLAAVVTTAGPCHRGYLFAEQQPEAPGVVSGLLGDAEAGPVVHVFNSAAGQMVIPPSRIATEAVLLVADGEVSIGGRRYCGGDLRIQAADAPLDAVVAGPDGVRLALVLGDRRAGIVTAGARPEWMDVVPGLLAQLEVFPGGTWRSAAA